MHGIFDLSDLKLAGASLFLSHACKHGHQPRWQAFCQSRGCSRRRMFIRIGKAVAERLSATYTVYGGSRRCRNCHLWPRTSPGGSDLLQGGAGCAV